MGTMELEAPITKLQQEENDMNEDELSPIEQVRLTVPNTDDPTQPVWTFRMWILGLLSCILLSFLNQFFSYRKEPLIITQITVQVATLPIGQFMAAVLPTTKFRILGFGSREFSLNPGPFNMKEHVLITIFANAGSAFGNGSAYAVGIVNIIKAFYGRSISFGASWLLIITTQVLGYGWAGLLRKYVVEPAHMWWPSTLVQISLFRALHEKEDDDDSEIVNGNRNKRPISRAKFFVIALVCSFSWYLFPGYIFQALSSISWVCWAYPNSVTAQQIGSGLNGLGVGAITLDWATVASFLFSPLICPFFAIANVFVGYALIMYVVIPISYWGFNVYNAKNFPLYSSDLFTAQGQEYNISLIVNKQFELDYHEYDKQGRINLSLFYSHLWVWICHHRFNSYSRRLVLWKTPGLNIITEYIMGVLYPGRPIANVCFKTYGYMSMTQAISFLSDFKLGHYMKIPPRSMFLVQFLGTIIAGTVNLSVAWWLLDSVDNICHQDKFSNSPWTCPGDHVFFDASVIWGLVSPRRIFGHLGNYSALNWFFLGGMLGPVVVWLLHKSFPKQTWIPLINLPVLLGATAMMPPATALNYNSWILVGTIFNFFVFRYRKKWWQRYNYILSAALDAGVAFMAVLLYFSVGVENRSINWWGNNDPEHCDLATCPTAKGISVDGCPTF
ncbi:unnamed protein product [Withania somnifera]